MRSSIHSRLSRLSLGRGGIDTPMPRVGRLIDRQEIPHGECVQVCGLERLHRFLRSADDRLLVHVEAGVDDRRVARELVVMTQGPVDGVVAELCYELRARGAVDVHTSRGLTAHAL